VTLTANMVATLGTFAKRTPTATAIIAGTGASRRTLTFDDVSRLSATWANTLNDNGVKNGDHVLVLQSISVELYLALLAVFRIGAIAVFPDPQALQKTIEAACTSVHPVAMIGGWPAQLLRQVSRPLRRIKGTFSASHVPWARLLPKAKGREAAIANVPADQAALITFTSGSTGAPKVIARSHGFLAAQHTAITRAVDFVPGTTTLTALPVFVLSHLASGVASILPASDVRKPKEIDPAPLLAQIAENNAHTILASPALVERLACVSPSDHPKLATVRDVLTGGGPIFPDIVDAATRAMPNARIHLAYGSTEAEPIAHITHDEISAEDNAATARGRGLLAGKPTCGTAVAILREAWGTPRPTLTEAEFDALRMPQGEPGEIVVAGDHVVASYVGGIGNAESKINVAGKVWHRTGDAGAMDGQGRLWLLGRCAYRLKDKPPLYPLQVEAQARATLGPVPLAAARVEDQAVLVIESTADVQAAQFHVDRVVTLTKIPLDRRHQSKVDYASLKTLLQR
jgi:acyl-CoA synthetase (AMP-forming)/AMP-acid ligase II